MKLDYRRIEDVYLRGINGSGIAIWEWNVEKNEMFFSENTKEIIDKNLGGFKNLFEFINNVVIEEDRLITVKELKALFNSRSNLYKSDFRVVTKKGNSIWIRIEGNVVKNNKDEIKLISGSLRDISEKKKLKEDVKYLYYYDQLTGLPNRVLFEKNFKIALEKWVVNKQKGSLIYIDINDFKSINDIYGPDYGDILLIKFSQILMKSIKSNGKLHRLSADEFIILIDNFNNIDELNNTCTDVISSLKEPIKLKENSVHVTVSIGVSIFPKDGENTFELYKYADLALNEAKRNGKNTFTFFEKSISNKYYRKFLIKQELKEAIEKDELYLVYQPQIDSFNNKVTGFEALLRWNNSKLGHVSPNEFIPIAESSGSIVKIGEWIIDKVCGKINDLNKSGYSFGNISINVSPVQLNRNDFITNFVKICTRNNVLPSLIEIEITEGMLIDLHNNKVEVLNEIIKRGIKIAVDDFGRGYSSLTYLTALSINTLKIDKSFIDNIYEKSNRAVVKCIIELCKALEYKIVAEGVEEKGQLEILNSLGCNIIQGYYYSKPLFEREVEKFNVKNKYND